MRTLAAFSAAILVLAAGVARAQDDGTIKPEPPLDKIVLTVHGSAAGKADSVVIEFIVEATAEDAPEAERLQRAKLKTVNKALAALKKSIDEAIAATPASSPEKPKEPASAEKPKTDDEDSPKKEKPRKARDDDDEDSAPKGSKKSKKRAADDGEDGLAVPIEIVEGRSIVACGKSNENAGAPPSATVATAVQVRMSGLEGSPRELLRKRLARIADKAIEAGADGAGGQSGGPVGHGVRPAFRFAVKDKEALRARAYEVALASGKNRAESIARLSGRELGPVSSIRETGWQLRAGRQDGVGFDVLVGHLGNNAANNHELYVSTTECELEVQLELEFSLKKTETRADEAKAAK